MSDTILGDHRFDRDEAGVEESANKRSARRGRWRRVAIVAVLLPITGVGLYKGYVAWKDSQHYETTDDAFVDGHISQVAPRVSGQIVALRVRDNEEVAAGQTLVDIDPRDFDIRLAQAKAQRATSIAQLKQTQAQAELQKANIDQAAANLRAAEAESLQATQDQARYNSIVPKAVTRQEVDRANASARSNAAKVDAGRQALVAAKAQLEATKAQIEAAKASVDQSQTQVDNALLQLSYASVKAQVAGQVTKRSVEVGNYVSPGQAIMSIVPDEVWVTANFKETQLADMRVGQPVTIRVDAFPKHTFRGRVDSFQSGTGSAFSTLPAENATGNYVKVVQRVPIKILFDAGQKDLERLSPGMSVGPEVKVR